MIYAILFIVIVLTGYVFSLWKGPFWGLISYITIYFFSPSQKVNWWAEVLPDLRWSLLSAGILLASLIIHLDKRSTHKLGIFYIVLTLYIVIELITNTMAISPIEAKELAHLMQGNCIIMILMIKILSEFKHLRLLLLIIIVLGAILGLQAIFEGKMMHGRVNNIGPADASGSNELGVLLSSIMPFTIPYIIKGRKYEKVICLLSLLLIIDGFTLTLSRGAFVALILSACYIFLLIANKKIKKYMLFACIILLPCFLYFADEGYVNRISSIWRADRSSDEALKELSAGRTEIWKYGAMMVNDHPFGVGPGGFRELSRFYMPQELLAFKPNRSEYGVRAAHNSYLQVLVELGYLGLFLYIIICLGVLYSLLVSAKKIKQIGKDGTFFDLLIMALNFSVMCTLIGGVTGSRFYYEFFWWQVAFVLVVKSFVIKMEQSYLNEKKWSHS
jgi:hypothetical protein